jgi:two-component system LytT family response regulator
MMLRAIVIDDIQEIRKANTEIIKTHCPNVAIIGQADSVETGVKLIRQVSPDLVFWM